MAHSLSAKKRIRQNEKRRTRNVARRSALKSQTRKFKDALQERDLDTARREFAALSRKLDQTAAHGTIHKKQASRRKSRFARQLHALASAS